MKASDYLRVAINKLEAFRRNRNTYDFSIVTDFGEIYYTAGSLDMAELGKDIQERNIHPSRFVDYLELDRYETKTVSDGVYGTVRSCCDYDDCEY